MPDKVIGESLPPKEAIRFLRQKVNMPTERWSDAVRGMHSRAFVVAGAQKSDMLIDFHDAVNKAIADGKSKQWFRKEFDSIVEKNGWAYNGKRSWRSDIIFTTNLSTAYAEGRYEKLKDPDVTMAFPYWQYVTMDDLLVRPEHASWNNTVLPHDDPWWDTHYPPNGWHCRCRVEPVTDSEYEVGRVQKEFGTVAPVDEMRDWRNPSTGEIERIPKGIDPGWDYNPGRAANGADPETARMIERLESGPKNWEPVAGAFDYTKYNRPERVPVDASKAKVGKEVADASAARVVFKKTFGADRAYIKNPVGETIQIDASLLYGKKATEVSRVIPLVKEAIENPYEIWLSFSQHKTSGRVALRQNYVKRFSGAGKTNVVVSSVVEKGRLIGVDYAVEKIKATTPARLNAARSGRMLYGRE